LKHYCNQISGAPQYIDRTLGASDMNDFEDHGLPLVQLKERRHELIVALMGRKGHPISNDQIAEIASLQQAIAAMETVIVDLDAETKSVFAPKWQGSAWLVASCVRNALRRPGEPKATDRRSPAQD
jgi:hypothetical protein